ncbi:MAG: acyl carrier protein [Acidobacteria bacterium]|nr:acyl carrier protein [Acidobacteriota bacterium]MBV9483441.1 acyl carrier protein [Acidobacteriota bacterium]
MQIIDARSEIRNFLVNNFLFGQAEALADNETLFGNIIDSSGALELVMFLEERFGISVEDEEVANPANFESFNTLVGFVDGKLRTGN